MAARKSSGPADELYVCKLKTALGGAVLVWSEKGLRRLRFGGAAPKGTARRHAGFEGALERYFRGEREAFDFPLDLSGVSRFQRSVLKAAREIPYGETRSYGQLAQRMGRPKAARAVAGALARNPLPIIIPCHRIVRANGSAGGFSMEGGTATKRMLLKLEGKEVP